MTPGNAPPTDDQHALAGEYVLGTLSGEARDDVAGRMDREPALREAVQAWEARLLPLAALAPPVEPSPALWSRIADSVVDLDIDTRATAGAPKAASVRQPARTANGTVPQRSGWHRWWSSLGLWRGLASGGFATAAVLAAVLVVRINTPQPPQFMVVLVAPGDKAPGWVVQARANQQQLSLVPLGNVPIPAQKSLQFWTKAEGWTGPVSLGLVEPGKPVTVPLDRLPPLQANQLFELTLEPATGSPIGRPTGPIQFIGRAVKVL